MALELERPTALWSEIPSDTLESALAELWVDGLQPLCACQLMQSGPQQQDQRLVQIFPDYFGRAAAAIQQIKEIDERLLSAGFEAIAFKGASFQSTLYPVLGTRPLSDLDLWVQPSDERGAADLLVKLGYERRLRNYYRAGWAVDLHVHPLNQYGIAFPFGRGWWESRIQLSTYRAVKRLPEIGRAHV